MSKQTMTIEKLTELSETYGADTDRWPQEMQQVASRLLDDSAAARQVLAEARWIDTQVTAALPPLDGAGLPALKRRIMERIGNMSAENSAVLQFWNWLLAGPRLMHFLLLRPAVLAMIPLMLGFALGASFPDVDRVDGELATELTLLALTDRFEGFTDAQ